MPDLNLIDDDGLEEMPEGAEEIVDEAGGGGGGGSKIILIILVLLIVGLGGVYLLNMFGVIHLWGQKQPQVMVEEQYPSQFYDESAFNKQPADTSWMTDQMPSDVALLDTTPFNAGAAAGSMAQNQVEMLPFDENVDKAPAAAPKGTTQKSALKEMKGDFTIQVVAYREEAKAKSVLSNLEFSGYPAFIEKVQMKGGDWYTVRIGKYATRAAAKEAVQTFASSIKENYFIDKIRAQ